MIKDHSRTFARPALWGFFICIILAGVITLARLFIPSVLTYRWNSERSDWRLSTEKVIRNEFQKYINQLTNVVEQAAADTILISAINLNNSPASYDVFRIMNSYKIHDNQTIELIDSQGKILAWNGASTTSNTQVIGRNSSERFERVIQNGLRTYLTVGISIMHGKYFLLASELIELNSPISNRFIQNVSLSDYLSQKLKVKVVLHSLEASKPNLGEFIVPIKDRWNNVIAEFSVAEKSLDSEIASFSDVCSTIIAVCLAIGFLFIVFFGIVWITSRQHGWVTLTAVILSLWLIRTAWLILEFPANIIGGWLFNPNLYASQFAFGLSSSLGELIISCVTLFLSTWFLFNGIIFKKQAVEFGPQSWKGIWRFGIILIVITSVFLVLWLFRGFDEALHSFVFDSTIRYNNPSEIFLDGTAALMHLNILLLGVSLSCVSIVLLWAGRKILLIQFNLSELNTRNILIGIILISLPIFALLDETPLNFLWCKVFFLSLILVLIELQLKWDKIGLDRLSQKWRLFIWMIIGSFLIGTTIHHQKLQLREHREVEITAREILRPSDSWLTFIVLDGMRTAVANLSSGSISKNITEARDRNLAFVQWTKTLLGKEGYNSALVLYDDQGNEADRFVVGISKTEQREMLTHVFESEEDVISIFGQQESKMGKMYGAWTTYRDSTRLLIGSLALVLSERQKMIFQGEETEPLRQYGARFGNVIAREIAIHEYKTDTLIYSTGRKLYPDKIFSRVIKGEQQKRLNNGLWEELTINGYKTHSFFLRDASAQERLVSISLEKLDIRWDLFNYLKVFFIYMLVLSIAAVYLFLRRSGGSLPSIGFRGKLFLGFTCITLLPLSILGYYNRQLVTERVQEQVEISLYRELNQLQERIRTYISDDEDFAYGMDDDFCEAIASEYGVDFSVYKQATIQASSRSELYRAALIDGRLNGNVYAQAVLGGKSFILAKEKIGFVEYAVGYAPISISGKLVGVLAIPTLNRQKEIESELAKRNAYVFGIYAIVFGIALAAGAWLSLRFARPLHALTQVAKEISEGNLEVSVAVRSKDEIGTLARSFNEMVSKLRTSMVELAKHERESAWKEMAKQVAHEIRNPLTPIKLSIQHLRQAFKDKAPEREDILQRVTQTVIDQIEALSKIASEFSNFAKMPETKFERLDIDKLLRETINLFREVQGVSFTERLASSSVTVVADRDQLRGVFINLIRNAIQAINKAGTISVETKLNDNICQIRISDTGPGISDEILSKIFMPNFSTKTEGMGLGLAIARRVIEDHGGTITCSSQIGKGTTFEIRLPV